MGKIYIENFKNEDNIYHFLQNNYAQPTYDVVGKFCATFKDEACTDLECKPARRSLEDLFDIVRTYYPYATVKDVAEALFKMNDEEAITCLFCYDIKKIVFYRSIHGNYKFFYKVEDVDGDYVDREGNGEYSIRDIYNIVGRETE